MPKINVNDQSFEVNEEEILYDALFDRGLELPHGCLSGSCGACRIEVLEGQENLMKPGMVEQDTVESLKTEFKATYGEDFVSKTEIRLACRAKVLGDVKIRPIK